MTPDDRCVWPKCRDEYDLHYLGAALCNRHWKMTCDWLDDGKAAEVAKALGLPLEKIKTTMGTVPVENED